MGPIYNVNAPLQCRQVRIYVKMEFPYYSIFIMILLCLFMNMQMACYNPGDWYKGQQEMNESIWHRIGMELGML